MKRAYILLLLFAFNSCDKGNNIEQPVELRFANLTGLSIDSVFFNVGRDIHNYKISDLGIDQTTDYISFNSSYWRPLATVHIDSLVISHPRTDLVCCLIEGKYTIELNVVLDRDNEQKTSTFAVEDN